VSLLREANVSAPFGEEGEQDFFCKKQSTSHERFWEVKCQSGGDHMLAPFRSAKYSRRTGGGALWSGADGPRPGAGQSATWRRG
jgi:hypothetical protein